MGLTKGKAKGSLSEEYFLLPVIEHWLTNKQANKGQFGRVNSASPDVRAMSLQFSSPFPHGYDMAATAPGIGPAFQAGRKAEESEDASLYPIHQ